MKFLENVLSPETLKKLKELVGEDLVNKVDEATKDFKIDVAEEKFIPKAKFDEVNTQIKDLKAQISDRDKQISDLGKLKDSGELSKKIEELEAQNKQAQADYEAKLLAREKDMAIDTYLMGQKAKNIKAVKAVLDLTGVTYKNNKLEGIDKLVSDLKASDSYLFDIDTKNDGAGGDPNKGKTPPADRFGKFRKM